MSDLKINVCILVSIIILSVFFDWLKDEPNEWKNGRELFGYVPFLLNGATQDRDLRQILLVSCISVPFAYSILSLATVLKLILLDKKKLGLVSVLFLVFSIGPAILLKLVAQDAAQMSMAFWIFVASPAVGLLLLLKRSEKLLS